MKNVVTFETAKRLKEAGFPQPEFDFGQFWYTPNGRICAMSGDGVFSDEARVMLQNGNTMFLKTYGIYFTPTATDILHELDKNTEGAFWWALIPLLDVTFKWVLQQRKGVDPVSILDFFNDNPAEAAAAAWLHLNKKK